MDVQWRLTAHHSTSTWDYVIDGAMIAQWDGKGTRTGEVVTHSLTNLPAGEHPYLCDAPSWSASEVYNGGDEVIYEGDLPTGNSPWETHRRTR